MTKSGITLSLAALAIAGAGCHRADAAPEAPAAAAPAVAVQVARPLGNLEHAAMAASGQIRSVREATLGARAGGTIERMRVEVGDRVVAGQTLVELDDAAAAANVALASATVQAARSDLRLADLELERQRQLLAGNAAPRAQYDRAEATRDSAAANLARTEASLAVAKKAHADHRLVAPFAGVVTARLKQAGESVAVSTPLVSLVDVANLEVRLDVPEAGVDALRNGMAVAGAVSPSGVPLEAKVKAIGAAVDAKSRTVEVLLAIAPAKEGRPGVRPGALVTVQLAPVDALAGPFVPAKAVQTGPEGAYVWVVEGGVSRRREIQGEAQGAELYRVARGLAGDEAIVVAGADRLKDGMTVRAVN